MTFKERIQLISQKKQSTILSASLVLAITFSISSILGLLRNRFLYAKFFSCCVAQLDVYNAAFRLPDLIFKLLVTGVLSASFIPVFSSYLHKNKKVADEIASTVINLLLITFIFISLIAFIFIKPISALIAAGFSPEQLTLMVGISRILLIAQIFFLLSNFVTAILQVNQIFIIPAISPIVYNLFIIISIFTLAPIFGIYGVAVGAVVGAFFHLAIQIPVLRRQGFVYYPIIRTKLSGVREIFRLMVPRILSLGLGEIENTVTLFFASSLASGSISLLNLALQFMYWPSRIFGTTVGQASLPVLSKNIAKNELNTFRNTVNRIIVQSLFIAVPISALILVERVSLIRLLYGSREFPWTATILTSRILAFLTPGIICQAVIQILVRAFYALHNTKIPFIVSTISLIVNILTSFYFVRFTNLGVIGLAISASVGNLIQLFGLLIMFIRVVDGFNWSLMLTKFYKIFVSALLMGISSWFSIKFLDLFILDTTHVIPVLTLMIISSIVGLLTYIFSVRFLKLDEANDYQKYFIKFKDFIFHK
ncbi:MAG: murein biosynthesis integral membrane protein MurJ [Candidatus Shapirobacteria bacterium]|jgi:putative peptidoglycan lipid II flippase|nr:murein biosynthesis integral membrane protein MurJ [Candidatus Shapirobacteria bacterium]